MAVREHSSCFTSLPTTDMFCLWPSESHKKTPLLPLNVHPSLSPFTRAPSQQSCPSVLSNLGPSRSHPLAAMARRLMCSCQTVCVMLPFPLPHTVQPCHLPLPAETLERESSSLLLLLRTYSWYSFDPCLCWASHTSPPGSALMRLPAEEGRQALIINKSSWNGGGDKLCHSLITQPMSSLHVSTCKCPRVLRGSAHMSPHLYHLPNTASPNRVALSAQNSLGYNCSAQRMKSKSRTQIVLP